MATFGTIEYWFRLAFLWKANIENHRSKLWVHFANDASVITTKLFRIFWLNRRLTSEVAFSSILFNWRNIRPSSKISRGSLEKGLSKRAFRQSFWSSNFEEHLIFLLNNFQFIIPNSFTLPATQLLAPTVSSQTTGANDRSNLQTENHEEPFESLDRKNANRNELIWREW